MTTSELIGEGNIMVCSVAGVEVNNNVDPAAIPDGSVMELHTLTPKNCPMRTREFGEAAMEACVLCVYAIPQQDPALAS